MPNSGWRLAALAAGTTAAMALAAPASAHAASAVASGPAVAAGWPQFQGNASHTGYEQAEKSVTRQNVHELSADWTQALPAGSVSSQVVVSGGAAYVMAANQVFAFDAATGTQLWDTTLASDLLGTPSVQGSLVLVAYNDARDRLKGYVVALDAATGAQAWQKEVGRMNPAALVQGTTVTTTSNRAYVSLISGQVAALDLAGGGLLWKSAVLPGSTGSICVLSPPSVSGTAVVVGGGGEAVTAVSAADGSQIWSDSLGTECGLSSQDWLPAISNGTVYAGWLGGMAALSLAAGTVSWDNQSIGSAFWPLSVTRDKVIASPETSSDQVSLIALNRSDGSLAWQSTTKLEENSGATFGGLTWAMSGTNRNVRAAAFNAATGQRAYSGAPFSDDIQGFAPVVDAGHVYINTGSELECLALPA